MAKLTKQYTYLGEEFSYFVTDNFDCDDFDFKVGEEVNILRLDFGDGLKFRLYATLIAFDDNLPTFAYPTISIFPRSSNISKNQQDIVHYLLKRHNLPGLSF